MLTFSTRYAEMTRLCILTEEVSLASHPDYCDTQCDGTVTVEPYSTDA